MTKRQKITLSASRDIPFGQADAQPVEHFKAVTGTSPLQYQKDLRLMHARHGRTGQPSRRNDGTGEQGQP